jgi:hypothetical protein
VLTFKGPFFKGRRNERIDKALVHTDSDGTARGKKRRKKTDNKIKTGT